jgi:hypothetical protein
MPTCSHPKVIPHSRAHRRQYLCPDCGSVVEGLGKARVDAEDIREDDLRIPEEPILEEPPAS